MNRTRVADWLTAMPTYSQSIGRLVAVHPTRGLAYCGIGTAAARCVLDLTSPIEMGTRQLGWGSHRPAFVVTGLPADANRHYAVYDALETHYGLDLMALRIRLDQLPPFLASAIGFYLPLRAHGATWELWELNDNLVPLILQRDALRVTLDVDAELVAETTRAKA